MIFFFDEKGTPIRGLPETIKQGSNKSSRVWLFMPISPTNFVNAYFTLPNGESVEPLIMTKANEVPNVEYDKKVFSCWFCDLKRNITRYAGTLKMSFEVYAEVGENEDIEDETITTDSIELTVSKGVFKPLNIEKTYTYEELMSWLGSHALTTNKIVNDLETNDVNQVLSASMGAKLNSKIETEKQERQSAIQECKTYADEQISKIDKLTRKVVETLPLTGENNIIYLVPNTKNAEQNIKDEYLWIDGKWELIGSTAIDLSDYQPKTDNGLNTTSKNIVGAINEVNEASAWVQALGTNQPNVENANNKGIPSVSIETMDDGTPRFKFENLKGEVGKEDLVEIQKNTNKIKAVENALIQVGTISKQNGVMTTEIQETGGSDLTGLTILDNSYATVNKISGNTVSTKNLFGFPMPVGSYSYHGIMLTRYENGEFYLSGTATRTLYISMVVRGNVDGRITVPDYLKGKKILCYAYGTWDEGYVEWGISTEDGVGGFQVSSNAEVGNLVPENATTMFVRFRFVANKTYDTPLKVMFVEGETRDNTLQYSPYFSGLKNAQISGIKSIDENSVNESVMQLPQTIELGKWDYIQNGKVVNQTITETFNIEKYNETDNTYNGTTDFVFSADRSQVAYKINTPISITDIAFENQYLVWDNGTETVETPTDESGYTCFDYGANTTEENEYIILLGGAE